MLERRWQRGRDMALIYLDELGDLGFDLTKEGTSRYFVSVALYLSWGWGIMVVRKE